MKKTVTVIRVVSVILLIATAVLIFSFSAQPSASSDKTSGGITLMLCERFYPHFSSLSEDSRREVLRKYHNPVRKAAHIAVYTALGLFASLSVITYKKPSLAAKNAISLGFCVLFSVSDEIHQLFVKGRAGMASDVLIDSIGVVFAVAALTLAVNKTKLKSIAFPEDTK